MTFGESYTNAMFGHWRGGLRRANAAFLQQYNALLCPEPEFLKLGIMTRPLPFCIYGGETHFMIKVSRL